ncbi:hypothetical protein [Thalassolituus sp. C2-1]|uniref:hypothetical protein n=1 Tax=Venatorbacter sp. C2-1 TaxID=2597518 RepID=UPI00119314B0|nr:hypothetical protein [Thalassolituus sp. C2-1]TVV43202.1 hypothetical protein FOT50_12235 [Thalassolituus sp. C2-1]
MYFIYLSANFWIFSMLALIPYIGITIFTGPIESNNLFMQITGFCFLGIFGWLSHASAIHQCEEDIDIIQGIKMGFQDSIMYIKLFLNLG